MCCTQCNVNAKYKCPVCRVPYCSVACYKEHKRNPCSAPPEPERETNATDQSEIEYEFPTEDTVAREILQLLEQSEELKNCLENPHVREILELLDGSPHPDRLIQQYMTEPIFAEFVDACLKIVQPQDKNER
ncbi:unnamed protein product [Arctia plantaginis]|uniref:HIT-type domain-containing protein n=1 Tax=Arctia plantaginis TaxID=874455 RepID=A0A8S1BRZ9_ARCPL|nr:unnamed protein product [Arctia plantaginis]